MRVCLWCKRPVRHIRLRFWLCPVHGQVPSVYQRLS